MQNRAKFCHDVQGYKGMILQGKQEVNFRIKGLSECLESHSKSSSLCHLIAFPIAELGVFLARLKNSWGWSVTSRWTSWFRPMRRWFRTGVSEPTFPTDFDGSTTSFEYHQHTGIGYQLHEIAGSSYNWKGMWLEQIRTILAIWPISKGMERRNPRPFASSSLSARSAPAASCVSLSSWLASDLTRSSIPMFHYSSLPLFLSCAFLPSLTNFSKEQSGLIPGQASFAKLQLSLSLSKAG